MHFQAFHELFPKIAMEKTRNLIFIGKEDIPDGTYMFVPLFCMDKKCDCRRAFLNVYKVNEDEEGLDNHVATISYGWEPFEFYRSWSDVMDDDGIREFKGPALDRFQPQSRYAPAILEQYIDMIAFDPDYIKRLKRHYARFKMKRKMILPPDLKRLLDLNEPCPCKSGKIFRQCCGKVRTLRRR